ncbi:MAG: FGGY family carbohydrate kinase [Acidimicrobiales bacterium]
MLEARSGHVTYVIGLDVGSQSIKGVLLDPLGELVATASHALVMSHPFGGWAEQDSRDWDRGIAAVIGKLLANAEISGSEVGLLNLACQVDGVVPISSRGDALAPAIIWLDRRADEQAAAMAWSIGAAHLFEITGLVPDASHSGPKIMWLRDHQPEVFANAAAFPPAAGYLLRRLTNELAIDHANASSSLLYDLRTRQWSEELLEFSGLDVAKLGRIVEASDVIGPLSADAARAIGLSTSCVVLAGTGDEHAGSIGSGAITSGIITDVTGTAEPVTVASKVLVLDYEGLVETHAHAMRDYYLVENPGFVSGGSTLWLAEKVLKIKQAELFDLAGAAPAGCDGLLFLPALSGAMTPRWNAHMRGAFAGLAMSHASSDMARAVLEGCAFALRDVTDRFLSLGLGGDEIRVVGGGAAIDLWMQIKADVTGRPVRRVLVKEATALGAALLAGVAAQTFHDIEDAAARTVTLAQEPCLPDPSKKSLYDDAYGRYRSLFDAVEGATT